MQIEFVGYNENFFNLSEKWLTDPEIKKLTMTPELAPYEQRWSWFKSLNQREDYFIWGILADEKPIGVVGIKHVDRDTGFGEYWGYIGEKAYIGHGIGRQMMEAMFDGGRKIGLNTMILKVALYNERAYALYQKMGFEVSGIEVDEPWGEVYVMKREL